MRYEYSWQYVILHWRILEIVFPWKKLSVLQGQYISGLSLSQERVRELASKGNYF
jgi:hypothetical protein